MPRTNQPTGKNCENCGTRIPYQEFFCKPCKEMSALLHKPWRKTYGHKLQALWRALGRK
mgnify:FL=1